MIQVATEVIISETYGDGNTIIKMPVCIHIVMFSVQGRSTTTVNSFSELFSKFPKAVLVSKERLQALEAVYKMTEDYMAVKELWNSKPTSN